MSRYSMDKALRQLVLDPAQRERFRADPAGFLAGYDLADAERAAFLAEDYATLYALGAHPFLLWSFTEAIWVHEVPRDELVRDYKAKTAAIGYPDFTT